jgi:general secretion pathway protein J
MSAPRTIPPERSGEAGFTLIEMLIATMLMGLILGALATVTAQWLPNWNRGMARLQRDEHFSFALGRVVADLSVAELVPPGNAPHGALFDGAELGVTFVRTAVGPNSHPGLEVLHFRETADADGPELIREHALYTPADPGALLRFVDPMVLIGPPFRVTFTYAGPDGAWRPTWHDPTQLPRSVRITVRNGMTQQTLAVSTAALVHIDTPAECAQASNVNQCLLQIAQQAQGKGGANAAPGMGAH